MKKLLFYCQLLAAGLSWLARPAQAQRVPVKRVEIKFGKPEPADFEAKNFVADSAAAAVVLYDGAKTSFELIDNRFKLVTERLTRIKILKKAGYKAATVEVPLYHLGGDEEKLGSLRGFTYLEAGGKLEKQKLDGSQVFSEDINKHVQVRKFTLPGVREGAVIEYAYTVMSDFFYNLEDWTFQRELPVRWSEYQVVVPEYFQFNLSPEGFEPMALQSRTEGTAQYIVRFASQATGLGGLYSAGPVRTGASTEAITATTITTYWAKQNLPALRPEEYITTLRDYADCIRFQLRGVRMPNQPYHDVAGNWGGLNVSLLKSEEFGAQLDQATFLAALVKPLVAQYPDPADRAAAVRALVLQAMKYNGTNTYYASGPLKRSYELHRGTAADVNLLLIAALRQADLPAQPVLLSTRSHGRINMFQPRLSQFNYVIGALPLADSTLLLLDATDPLLPCGMLPTRCLSQVGRPVVGPAGNIDRWISLQPRQRHSHYQEVKLTLDAQGNLSGQVADEFSGYSGALVREKLLQTGEKKYVAELAGQHPGWELPSYAFSHVADVAQPLRLSYELRQPASPAGAGQELFIKPLEGFGESKNPFAQAQRHYPIDLGAATQNVVMLTLTLPPGYTAELPQPTTVDLPNQGGRYFYAATSPRPGTVQLVSRLSLSKPVYGAEDYDALREFYRLALAKQAEALVVKKM